MSGTQQIYLESGSETLQAFAQNPSYNYPLIKNGYLNNVAPDYKRAERICGATDPPWKNKYLNSPGCKFVLTLDNSDDDKGNSKSQAGWVWDEDGNKFIKYDIPVSALPIYKCSYCQMSFRGSGALSKHLQSRCTDGTKDISRNTLGFSASTKSHLNKCEKTSKSLIKDTDIDNGVKVNIHSESNVDWENNDDANLPGHGADTAEEPQSGEDNSNMGHIPVKANVASSRSRKKRKIPSKTGGNKNRNNLSTDSQSDMTTSPIVGANIESIDNDDGNFQRGFRCKLCGYVFSMYSNAHRHIKTVHLKEKQHRCTICSKTFANKQYLEVHMNYHSGFKPFKCDLCPATFFQRTLEAAFTYSQRDKTLHV